MAKLADSIIKAAVKLPERDRVHVVEQLLTSLESEAEDDVDAAWAAEIETGKGVRNLFSLHRLKVQPTRVLFSSRRRTWQFAKARF